MGEPQPILQPLTPAAIFLVVTIDDGGEALTRALLGEVSDLRKSVGFRLPAAQLTCVTAIGSKAWDRLFTGPRPAELHDFPGYEGKQHTAPATPGDVLFHIKATVQDACFELAMLLGERLRGAGTIVDQTVGFRYFEQRDLLGFVDGTANPEGAAAVSSALVSADTDPDFAGGSYVIVQKYLHPLEQWRALTVQEQERVIGRTKLDDIEIPDDVKLPDSHVAVNTIVDSEGAEHDIVRGNMPFGNVQADEFGTYYIAYSATPSVTEQMLTRMFIGTGEAAYDRILDFSIAKTGTLFFAPSLDFLDNLPAAPSTVAAATPALTPALAVATDTSLQIGTMKGATQ